MDTYNPNELTAAPKKVDISLRQLADFDQTGGDRNRVDNVRDNQVLVSLSKFNRPKTFSFRYISDILLEGNGVTIATDKDGITTISNSGVTKIIAGTNITISPTSGVGDVTITSTGGGGGGVPYTGAIANVDLGVYNLKADALELSQTPVDTAGVGKMVWNNSDGTIEFQLKGGNVTLQVGQEQVVRIVNKVGSNLLEANYQCVRVRTQAEGGAAGQRLAIKLAQANTKANHTGILGLVTETINNNQEGFITTFGLVRNIDTTGNLQGETWLDGDTLWLSETTAGGLTNVEPTTHPVQIGYVVYAHQNNGKIFVSVSQGVDELGELHNVDISSPTNWQLLRYNSSTSRWINDTLVASVLPSGIDASKIGAGTVDNTEFGYLNGVTSSIQTQLNAKQGTLTLTTTGTSGAATLVGSTLNIPQYGGGGGGGTIYKLTAQTLTAASWTLSGSYYTYTFSNVNITTNTRVDFTPDNSAYNEVTTCGMLPEVDVSSGSCTFYSLFPPQSNILGEVTIFPTV
jgi:hypothetical protein